MGESERMYRKTTINFNKIKMTLYIYTHSLLEHKAWNNGVSHTCTCVTSPLHVVLEPLACVMYMLTVSGWVWFLNDLVTIAVSQDGNTRAYSHSSVECLRELPETQRRKLNLRETPGLTVLYF